MSSKPTQPIDGMSLLRSSALNKSTAFSEAEREHYGLTGLLPAHVENMQAQIERALASLRGKDRDIDKYIYLADLQDRNEQLFYRLVINNFQEIMPLIYTPTVGQACKQFASIYCRERGFYVSPKQRGAIRKSLDNWPNRDVRIIVVTDGERILGLGDLGANGMGIPIGKLSLYVACAGIDPSQCLPVMFDVGTDNQELLDDPIYLGLRERRLRGEGYLSLMDEFIEAAKDAFPGVLIQFEDFNAKNAYALLGRYHKNTLCFNDDIQGTAAVVLAGAYAAGRLSGTPFVDMRFLFLGAGSAATGIGGLIVQALIAHGLSESEAYQRLWFFNRTGLVRSELGELAGHVQPFAQDMPNLSFIEAIEQHRPDILIGATGTPNTFTQPIVEAMAAIKERPVIFALSNPTSRAECTAEQAYQWTSGRGIFASGSPFAPVHYNDHTFYPGQGNNAYIFPGVGLGMLACQGHHIPDRLFIEVAKVLADCVSEADLARGAVYPAFKDIRCTSLNIATAVAEFAYAEGLAKGARPDDLRAHVESMMYDPGY